MTFCEQILIYPFQTTISFSLIHSSVLWPFSVFDVWFMATEFQLLCHMTYDVKHDGGNNHGVLKHSSVSWRVRVGGSGQAVAGDVDRMFGVTLYRVAAPQPATASTAPA